MKLIFLFGLIFFLIDYLITLGSFGFYHTSFNFNMTSFKNNIFFLSKEYYFTKNGNEFLLLFIYRLALIFISVFVLIKYGKSKGFSIILLGSDLCNMSFSLTKILAFAEYPIQLFYIGIYINIVWNIIASILVHFYYSKFLIDYFTKKTYSNNYEQLENDNGIIEQTSQSENNNTENEINDKNTERVSTSVQIFFLLKYYLFFWKEFLLGFIFLVIYAFSKLFIFVFLALVLI